jgi:hypothetical protein
LSLWEIPAEINMEILENKISYDIRGSIFKVSLNSWEVRKF